MMMTWYDRLQADLRLESRRAARQANFTVVAVLLLAVWIVAAIGAFLVPSPKEPGPLPVADAGARVAVQADPVEALRSEV